MKQVSLLGLATLALCACSSTDNSQFEFPQQANEQIKLNTFSQTPALEAANQHLVAANERIEEALNQQNWRALELRMKPQVIAGYIENSSSESIRESRLELPVDQVAKALKKGYIRVLRNSSPDESIWIYLGSEPQKSGVIRSHYRIELSEGYVYMDLMLDPQDMSIVDVRSLSSFYTTAEIMASILSKKSLLLSSQETGQLLSALSNNDLELFRTLWKGLDESKRYDRILLDAATRLFSTNINNLTSADVTQLLSYYPDDWPLPFALEGYFLNNEEYDKAIECLNNMPRHAISDSKIQSELALLYFLKEEFEPAWHHSQQAIVDNPYDLEAYFVMLQISLGTKEHGITSKLLHVLEERFQLDGWEQILPELEDYEDYMESDAYLDFKNQDNS